MVSWAVDPTVFPHFCAGQVFLVSGRPGSMLLCCMGYGARRQCPGSPGYQSIARGLPCLLPKYGRSMFPAGKHEVRIGHGWLLSARIVFARNAAVSVIRLEENNSIVRTARDRINAGSSRL